MNAVHKSPTSFFNHFEDDRITDSEMFDTLGGIEQNEMIENIAVDDPTFEDTVFDGIVPDWKNKDVDLVAIKTNFPKSHQQIFSVRPFRTFLQFLCINFKNRIR